MHGNGKQHPRPSDADFASDVGSRDAGRTHRRLRGGVRDDSRSDCVRWLPKPWTGPCEEGTRAARVLRATTNAVRFTADQTVPGSSIAEVARAIDEAVTQQQQVRTYLDELANSPDPYGRLLTRALCTGMEQLKDFTEEDAPPTDEEWSGFLAEQLKILAPNNLIETIQAKVDGLTTAAQLSRISPRGAAIYFRQCVAKPR